MIDPRWSWFFSVAGLATVMLLSGKSRWGHAVGAAKEAVFVAYGLVTSQPGFVVSGAIFAVVFADGFRRWSRPDPVPEPAPTGAP